MNYNDIIRAEILDALYKQPVNMTFLCQHIPELELLKGVSQPPYHSKDVYEHTEIVVNSVSNYLVLKLSALLHDIAKPQTRSGDDQVAHFYSHEIVGATMAQNILGRLGFDPDITKDVYTIITLHMKVNQYKSEFGIKYLRQLYRETDNGRLIPYLTKLSFADRTSDKIGADVDYELGRMLELRNRIIMLDIPEPRLEDASPLTGKEIMESLNIQPSKEVGLVKTQLALLVLKGIIDVGDSEAAKERIDHIYQEILVNKNDK